MIHLNLNLLIKTLDFNQRCFYAVLQALQDSQDSQRHFKTKCIIKMGYPRSYGCIKQYLRKIEIGLLLFNIFFFYSKKKSFFKNKRKIVFTLWFIKCSNANKIKRLNRLYHLYGFRPKPFFFPEFTTADDKYE